MRKTKFFAGDVNKSLASLNLSDEQLTNGEGIRQAIVSTFRANAGLKDGKAISQKLDLGFEALQYLNNLTGFLRQVSNASHIFIPFGYLYLCDKRPFCSITRIDQ